MELLSTLAGDQEGYVRSSVATNPCCPVELLSTLAGDQEDSVRSSVAANPCCPVELLSNLAGDQEDSVRSSVAANPCCPVELLSTLSDDQEGGVRWYVARNPRCPLEVLNTLADNRDEDDRVRTEAWRNLRGARDQERSQNGAKWVGKGYPYKKAELWKKAAENPETPVATLEKINRVNADGEIRQALASNPRFWGELVVTWLQKSTLAARKQLAAIPDNGSETAAEIYERASQDDNCQVRQILAANPCCPERLFLKLAEDPERSVRRAAGLNLESPVALMQINTDPTNSVRFKWLVEEEERKSPGIREAVQRGDILYSGGSTAKMINSISLLDRVIALSQEDAMPDKLARASSSNLWLQRMAVARNKRTPPNILTKLAGDPNYLVAQQAKLTVQWLKKNWK